MYVIEYVFMLEKVLTKEKVTENIRKKLPDSEMY